MFLSPLLKTAPWALIFLPTRSSGEEMSPLTAIPIWGPGRMYSGTTLFLWKSSAAGSHVS